MSLPRPLLIEVLLAPERCAALELAQWDLLIRQARRANLLPRLAHTLAHTLAGQTNAPPAAQRHLESALLLARRQGEITRREVSQIRQALAELPGPKILLKGAAYLARGLQLAQGRMFSDVDVLVPREHLDAAETALMVHGWEYGELDAYDSRYYRQWMHELPPLQHRLRGTTIDVHHTILPPTARTAIATEALFETLVELPEWPGVHTLSPADMLLHSATHLFHEGEFDNGLRDLFDLDALLREFGSDAAFWPQLLARARRIGLTRPLHHALRYVRMVLGTPVPEDLLRELDQQPGARPDRLTQALLDYCYRRALHPQHASCAQPGTGLALRALYVRSHWQRMPAHLLLYHLGRKQLKRWTEKDPETPVAA